MRSDAKTGGSLLRGSVKVAFAATALAASAACAGGGERAADGGKGEAPIAVGVAEPVATVAAETGEYVGQAEAVHSVDVRARVAGQLQRVAVPEGKLVKKGELLFVVDPRPYEAALARARATLERANASASLARIDHTRARNLLSTRSIPRQELDTSSSTLDQQLGDAKAAAADVATAELNLEFAFVRAPVDGRIGRANITVGNLVGPDTSTPLANLTSVDPIYVYFDVEEARALRLPRPRAPMTRRGHDPRDPQEDPGDGGTGNEPFVGRVGFAGEEGFPHEGTLDFIDNRVDPGTGTIRLRLVVPNRDGRLSAGLFARVQLPDGRPRPLLLVSDRALGTDQDRRFVYVVDRDNKAQYRRVELGSTVQSLRVVREGLSPGERIVVRGLQRVRPGAVVSPEAVSMTAIDQPDAAPPDAR